jgi:hypothetical protein
MGGRGYRQKPDSRITTSALADQAVAILATKPFPLIRELIHG